jgi:hypothetical protein
MTPQDIVSSLKYLQQAGMSAGQVCAMHHFDDHQSYSRISEYFSKRSYLRSDTNKWFGQRLAYVVQQHKQGRRGDFTPLIFEAVERWPIRR